jgi:ABC-2 type transport system ATP-binding protein
VSVAEFALEATAIRKRYGTRVALEDVSLRVRTGEVVGLLGPNGAGKTTTLSVAATILKPDAGKVRIAGLDADANRAEVRRKLGFVPQSIALYPALSASSNIELFARIHGMSRREARRRGAEALELARLSDRACDPVWTFSGGMQRRLNLACGLVHRPEVLLLDEATVGVDPQSREEILMRVRAAARAGAAVVYSTHYMDEVERLCDLVFLIDRGRVIAQGTVAELIALGGGRPRMELMFNGDAPAGWHLGLAGVSELSVNAAGKRAYEIDGLARVNEVLERARGAGCAIAEFAVHSPNLADAFIALTGRALRE